MSTIKSSAENLTLNADGANNDIKFQSNGSEVASIDQAGTVTATTFTGAGSTPSIVDGGNATAMTITSAEKIGIGTATPICLVELEHSNTTALSGDGDDSAINIHNTGGVNAISTISFSGGDHNGDGNLAGIYAKHTNVTENSETTDIGFKTSLNEVQVDNLILRGDRGLSEFTAKAWVNFNGTGTIAIRDSHNVSSLTDVNTGNYKYNYTNAMATANYAYVGGVGEWNLWTTGNTPNTAYSNLNCFNGSGLVDHAYLMAITFGA